MRAWFVNDILFLHQEDVPAFKKQGSVVRNNYFWALRAIAGHAPRHGHWEYEPEVWLALARVLTAFQTSGYLGLSETQLAFPQDCRELPSVLQPVATWQG